MKPIPYGRQEITEEDINEVINTLNSDYLTQGPKIAEFEKAFASYVGSNYAVAVSNGTAALHLSCLALEVKKGSKVITTPITFVASANCVKYCQGEVVFSDINPETYLLDIKKLRQLLVASPEGTYQGIVPVDFAGRVVNMEEVRGLANEFNLWIIEDSCHAPGGYFIDSAKNRQLAGNGNFADLSVFSFHPVKHIASGEGGMITTNNEELYQKLLSLRTHGIIKNEDKYKNSQSLAIGSDLTATDAEWPGWYMEMQELGYNYRLTDFQAALGISQLKRAEEGLKRRTEIAEKYTNELGTLDEIKRMSGLVAGHAYHLYIIEVEDRLGLYNFLRKHNIYAQIHYIPAHLMPYYQQFGWKLGDFPNAEAYYNGCISLPMYPTLSDDEQSYVIEKIKEFYI